MPDYYLVREARGPAWDPSRRRREQEGWDEHAAFMDVVTAEGMVVLGGPVGEDTDQDVVLVSTPTARRRSAPASPTTRGSTRC